MTLILLPASRVESGRTDLLERRLRRFHPRFQGRVRLLAARHPHIADLAISFPALLFSLAVPRTGFDPALAIGQVIAGRSLAEAAVAADLPMWVRKLPAEAFTGPIPKLPNGELFRRQIANHLPRSSKLMPVWLETVAEIAEIAHEPAAIWIAREFIREPRRGKPGDLRLIGLWVWFSTQPATFGHSFIEKPWTPDIRIGQAREGAETWQDLIELHLNLGFQPIADMWLKPACVAGYDFLPLNSAAAVAEEAAAMRNCLRTYGGNLAHNHVRLWSVRRDGQRVATLKVSPYHGDPLLNISELKGPGNVKVSPELWWAARQWLNTHDLLNVDARRRGWGAAALDRAIWLSLWRPYWLAKQHIPEWLPIMPSRNVLAAL